ncbi:MAG: sodium:proton antiporter [Candidatus Spechtbacterales bacterium]|nr:sodium:proton antiporter [Candidatus Spechtbacterales bacterium]
MTHNVLIGLASILLLGVSAQWLAWRFKLPSILVLLTFGFVAGAGTGLVNPEQLLGESLLPVVSLAVAVILFEGGLNLRLKEIKEVKGTVTKLTTIGALLAWAFTGIGAYYILGLDVALSVLLGAILVVSGPTVIMPILRHIRPTGPVGSILKWEGILIDPIGAFLAVLVFEVIFAGKFQGFNLLAFLEIFKTIGVATIMGGFGALFIILALKHYWVPDFLHNSTTLMSAIAVFTISDILQHESGLFAVIIMGGILANQKSVSVKHIVEFKENLQVLLIGGLFILLAAQLTMADIATITISSFIFLAVLILIVRPLSVYISTRGTNITSETKLFLSAMAPRGIVAAAVASIFALRLQAIDYPEAERIIPITFFVIVGTVAVYGLSALPLAKKLNISDVEPQGVLILGAHSWARKIGTALKKEEIQVLFIDSSWTNSSKARMEGHEAVYTNALSEHAIDEVNLGGIGYLLALTPNDQVNSLVCMHFADVLDKANVYQLATKPKGPKRQDVSDHLLGRLVFRKGDTHENINKLFEKGATIKAITLTQEFPYGEFLKKNRGAIPMFIIDNSGKLIIMSQSTAQEAKPGQKLIAIIP